MCCRPANKPSCSRLDLFSNRAKLVFEFQDRLVNECNLNTLKLGSFVQARHVYRTSLSKLTETSQAQARVLKDDDTSVFQFFLAVLSKKTEFKELVVHAPTKGECYCQRE